ncbi:MAG: lipid-A-disaccharide synthase N-terminal domain-containing protein [Candidatus Abyssubacteria bacterium]
MNWEQWIGMDLVDRVWLVAGLTGQAVFFTRFLVQWIVSERRGESVIPNAFWFLSLSGSLILLAYAVHIRDLVFTLGQAFGFTVYIRNLMLIYGKRGSTDSQFI